MKAIPITYIKSYIGKDDLKLNFNHLRDDIAWEQRDAPRKEAFISERTQQPYTYGRGRGIRTYYPRYEPLVLENIRKNLQLFTSCRFEACFLNYYLNQSDHLGWHADDSELIDHTRPIAVISFGVERYIYFRENGSKDYEKLLLNNGSLLLMHAGMQLTHEHRIPKHDRQCGERISLTFRGLL